MYSIIELGQWMEKHGVAQEYYAIEKLHKNIGNCQFATGATIYGSFMHERGMDVSSTHVSSIFMDLLKQVGYFPLWHKKAPRIPFASIAMAVGLDQGLEVRFSHEGDNLGESLRKYLTQAVKDKDQLLAWGLRPHVQLLENSNLYPNVNVDQRGTKYRAIDANLNYLDMGFRTIFVVNSAKYYRNTPHTGVMEGKEASGIHALGGLAVREGKMLIYDPDGGYGYQGEKNPATGLEKSRVYWIDIEHLKQSAYLDKPLIAVKLKK